MNMDGASVKSTRNQLPRPRSCAVMNVPSQLGCRVSTQRASVMIVITIIICAATFGNPH